MNQSLGPYSHRLRNMPPSTIGCLELWNGDCVNAHASSPFQSPKLYSRVVWTHVVLACYTCRYEWLNAPDHACTVRWTCCCRQSVILKLWSSDCVNAHAPPRRSPLPKHIYVLFLVWIWDDQFTSWLFGVCRNLWRWWMGSSQWIALLGKAACLSLHSHWVWRA